MARDGAATLVDLIPPRLSVVIECTRCERRGLYNLARLIRAHGDTKLPDLAAAIAKCERANAANFHNRCNVKWSTAGAGLE